ncbi:multisubunit sodium/proton antiporter, MrpD subunit (2.A.63.1) [Methanosalsum zhilinae DSM 4017]|uniref:Multisubunit sodium/proton antiporter, MrpD subunit (2.A.63.1) n=1 Tax=Methanosalsum zhilinae (strain DSM 4017 / NBRC 107636 / OCM 62 / WeN5) TaxID=679901 RepID=F7XLW3_METZD|nr:NADH-quinone oxidoreductase subunit M [Methanosalsum zhilinae]AEH60891.1 multisubunit sodium/proton antiporter, MrpD subunit (2.A.63.1) [Methanosalsum zhilinae DSM 4017]
MNFLDHVVVLLIAIPILVAALMVIIRPFPNIQKWLNLTVSIVLFILSVHLFMQVWNNGIIVYDLGNWGKYGIILVADLLSSGMVALSSVITFLALLFSIDYIEKKSLNSTYHSLFNLLVAGLNGTFLTGDLFNLFVFFEILLIASCGLLIANEKLEITPSSHKMEAVYKYLVLNIVATLFMLIAIASLYATVGTLNMADMAAKIALMNEEGTLPWHLIPTALLFMVVFGNKAAIFPLHFWLPDAHPTAPSPVSAILSGILIKVGAYGFIRFYYLIFEGNLSVFQPIIIFLGLATIIIGSVSAVGQDDIKKVLAYHSIGQIGYVFIGIGMGTAYALAASIVYLMNHAISKSMLFLVSGCIVHKIGTRDMRKIGGLSSSEPFLGLMFLIGIMSIAGLPPTSGFIAKFVLFDAGIDGKFYIPVLIAVIFSLFTLFSMFKSWQRIFWGEIKDNVFDDTHIHENSHMMLLTLVIMAIIILAIGLYAEPILAITIETANQILDPQAYIDAVLEVEVR